MSPSVRKSQSARGAATRTKRKKNVEALKHQPTARGKIRAASQGPPGAQAWTEKQFTVRLPNKPGQMARLGRVFKRAKVNMTAMSVSEQADTSAVRFLVDQERAAKQALDKAQLHYDRRKVVVVRAENVPGILGDVSAKLGKVKINIDYAYASSDPNAMQALLILAVDDPLTAVNVLA